MKKVFHLILIFILVAAFNGCSRENTAVSTTAGLDKNSSAGTGQSENKQTAQAESSTKVEFEYIDNLKELEIDNLNQNKKSVLTLPSGWHAKKATYEIGDSFKFKQDKNKGIQKLYSYEIFDEKNVSLGSLEFLGYYSDQPNGAALPNHSLVTKTLYTGGTKLGSGIIYLLNSDLPKEQVTEKYSTYDQVYAVIPIQNEELAYKLSISIPLGEDDSKYIEIMKKMLIET